MAPKLDIRPARLCDALAFARMREADAREVMASGGYKPIEAVIESWRVSTEAWTVRLNGEVACMFGVLEHPQSTPLAPAAVVWMLTTNTVDLYPITFVRNSKKILRDLSARYGLLVNFVDARYSQALSWARKIGFDVKEAVPFGRGGEPFHPIAYEVDHV